MISSTADRTVVAPIINGMLLFVRASSPPRKLLILSNGTVTTALNAYVAANQTYVLLHLNPATVFVDQNNFTMMDFGGLLLTSPIRQVNITGVGTSFGATTYATVTALTPADIAAAVAAAVTATAANQAFVAQQQATAATLAVTLPTEFNSNNLPPKAKTRYENHLNPSHLMT